MNTLQSENNKQSGEVPTSVPTSQPIAHPIPHNDSDTMFHVETYDSIDLEENLITEPPISTDQLIENEERLFIRIFVTILVIGIIITAFYTFF